MHTQAMGKQAVAPCAEYGKEVDRHLRLLEVIYGYAAKLLFTSFPSLLFAFAIDSRFSFTLAQPLWLSLACSVARLHSYIGACQISRISTRQSSRVLALCFPA